MQSILNNLEPSHAGAGLVALGQGLPLHQASVPCPALAAAWQLSPTSVSLGERDLYAQATAVCSESPCVSPIPAAGSRAGDPFATPFARSSLLPFPGEQPAWVLSPLAPLCTTTPCLPRSGVFGVPRQLMEGSCAGGGSGMLWGRTTSPNPGTSLGSSSRSGSGKTPSGGACLPPSAPCGGPGRRCFPTLTACLCLKHPVCPSREGHEQSFPMI